MRGESANIKSIIFCWMDTPNQMTSKISGKHLNYNNNSTYHSNICYFSLSYELIWRSVCCNFTAPPAAKIWEICFIDSQGRTSFVDRGDAASVYRARKCAPEPIRSAHPTTSFMFSKRSIPANIPISSLPFAIPFRSICVSSIFCP